MTRVGHSRWRCTSALLDLSGFQRVSEEIRSDDGVLDGVVDSDSADGGHDMRRIADQEETGLVPDGTAAGRRKAELAVASL